MFTTKLHQVNSKLVSSKFQQDQEQSKDKELTTEINTNLSKEYFLIFAGKLKYKSSIIRTSSPLARRSPKPTPRVATLSVSFLTYIKLRFLLLVSKFKISDSLLQRSCISIDHCHSVFLKNQQRQVLDPLSWKSKQKH